MDLIRDYKREGKGENLKNKAVGGRMGEEGRIGRGLSGRRGRGGGGEGGGAARRNRGHQDSQR